MFHFETRVWITKHILLVLKIIKLIMWTKVHRLISFSISVNLLIISMYIWLSHLLSNTQDNLCCFLTGSPYSVDTAYSCHNIVINEWKWTQNMCLCVATKHVAVSAIYLCHAELRTLIITHLWWKDQSQTGKGRHRGRLTGVKWYIQMCASLQWQWYTFTLV